MEIFLIVLLVIQCIGMIWGWWSMRGEGIGFFNRLFFSVFWPLLLMPINVQ